MKRGLTALQEMALSGENTTPGVYREDSGGLVEKSRSGSDDLPPAQSSDKAKARKNRWRAKNKDKIAENVRNFRKKQRARGTAAAKKLEPCHNPGIKENKDRFSSCRLASR